MAVADQVWMLENAIYSILSPEGFASILWKDSSRAKEAAGVMKITASDLLELQIIDGVIEEPEEYHVGNMKDVVKALEQRIGSFLSKQQEQSIEEMLEARYERFRKF